MARRLYHRQCLVSCCMCPCMVHRVVVDEEHLVVVVAGSLDFDSGFVGMDFDPDFVGKH